MGRRGSPEIKKWLNGSAVRPCHMYFVSGVSGVGKTAVMPHLRALLGEGFEVHDFDERGVPDNADHEWRLSETRHWIEYGQKKSEDGITVIVCGFSNPDEIAEIQKEFPHSEVQTILLDADAEVIEARLRNRNTNPDVMKDLERAVGPAEEFIQNNTRFVPILREICQKRGCPIVDTTHLSPEEVAAKIADFIK